MSALWLLHYLPSPTSISLHAPGELSSVQQQEARLLTHLYCQPSHQQVMETAWHVCLPHQHRPGEGFQGHICPPGTVPCACYTIDSFAYSCNLFSEHLLYARHYAGHRNTPTTWASQSLPETACWEDRQVSRKLPHHPSETWEHRRCDEWW